MYLGQSLPNRDRSFVLRTGVDLTKHVIHPILVL
jgi:hypothetical protein